ncbi:S41 family peptidase [Winogradskyella thalassocola]|uniref:Peptidase family S41 n=1 Tax=Winogradskyella thalassocola TaxID=262004 RepID=A0A1G8D9B1_9FLAO|nr:S41 family peptidase [Winogradskyella thalassocola]SDH54173.1 Peptidase family S41 [Winogradskyella thalassocola]
MSKITLLFLCTILLLLTSCASVEKHNMQVTKLHSVEDLHEDIDKVYDQLQRHHPHLYQFTSKDVLDFKFDSLKSAIDEPMDSRTFYKQLAAVTKYVGQGHMSLSPPSIKFTKKERQALNKTKFDINNLNFEYLDEKLIIVNARGNDSVYNNAEVLKIEDETPQDLINNYKKIIASDGYNTTFYNRYTGTRFMSLYSKDKGRFDSLTFTLRNMDSTFVKMYKRVLIKDTTTLKQDAIKSDSLTNINKRTSRLTKAERKAKKLESKAKRKNNQKYGYDYVKDEYARNLDFVGKDSASALLKIRGFSYGNYEDFYDETFKTLDSLKTETLIIDLRNNFGGSLDQITYLYSYLTDENFNMINPSEVNSRTPFLKSMISNSPNMIKGAFVLVSPIIATLEVLKTEKKEGVLYYKLKSSKEKEAKPLNFKGKIYVLINGNSFSASAVLSAKLHGKKRAIFVGEETGGAYNGTVAGMYKYYNLPNTKMQIRIPLVYIGPNNQTEIDGYGVKPDVEILPTYEDRLHNVDPELEWVLKDLEQNK